MNIEFGILGMLHRKCVTYLFRNTRLDKCFLFCHTKLFFYHAKYNVHKTYASLEYNIIPFEFKLTLTKKNMAY